MGLEAATLTALSAGATGIGVVGGIVNNNRARKAQEQAKNEQAAQNKSQELEERRRQFREERVKRARIMQSAEGTGTSGSSGELGALGGLATNLSSNVGQNLDAINRGSNISGLQQDAADASNTAQMFTTFGQLAPTAIKVGNSIFSSDVDTDPLGTFIKQKGF